jgi:hypothetical protein
MENWRDLGMQNRTAAHELFGWKRWRACVNRAYFAAYSRATDALLAVPISMPRGREGPNHIALPNAIGYNLTALGDQKRWKLADMIRLLYDLRCLADYRPSVDVGESEARIALGLMRQAFSLLE